MAHCLSFQQDMLGETEYSQHRLWSNNTTEHVDELIIGMCEK